MHAAPEEGGGMRIPINLAREPFRRDRPILIGSAFAAILLLATLALLISLALTERRETRDTQAMLARVNRRLNSIHGEQAKLDASMRLPGNEVVLDRSVLINTLIRRKAISWTRIFADLETVLPHDVRIVAIRPTLNAQGGLFLDMTVAAGFTRFSSSALSGNWKGRTYSASTRSQWHNSALADQSLLPLSTLCQLCPEALTSKRFRWVLCLAMAPPGKSREYWSGWPWGHCSLRIWWRRALH